MYWVVPYLLVAAPPIILLLSVMVAGCTATSTDGDRAEQARFYSDPDSRAGQELLNKLTRRETGTELQRIIDGAQR